LFSGLKGQSLLGNNKTKSIYQPISMGFTMRNLPSVILVSLFLSMQLLILVVDADIPFGINVKVDDEVSPSTTFQLHPDIAVDNTGIVYVVWRDRRNNNYDIYFANSTDGGNTFSPNRQINDDAGSVWQLQACIAVDSAGKIYVVWKDERNGDYDIYFANSTDGGNTFSANKKINDDTGTAGQDSPSITVDNAGNIYIAWADGRNGNMDIYFTNSTDGGNTFSANKKVNDDAGTATQGTPSIAVDNADIIYVAWTENRNGNYDIYFTNSTDGGITFSANKKVNDDAGTTGQYSPSIAAYNTGNVYVAWLDNRDGNEDIYFANSTNAGNTFSANKKINDDPGSADQYHPSLSADNAGNVHVVWTDERNGNLDIYYANSTDGGNTFSTNKKVNDDAGTADQRFPSVATDDEGNAYIAWEDERNSLNYDIYFTTTGFHLFNIQEVDITDTTTTITWNTNMPANSTVEYGLSTAYGSTVENSSMVTSHIMDLTGLELGKLYHFRVTSYNSTMNYNISKDFTFIKKYPIPLEPGWNLISLPLNQTDIDLGIILEDIFGEYDAVQWFNVTDSADPWKHNTTFKTIGSDLQGLNNTMGFWIHITNPAGVTFFINGTALDAGNIPDIPLHKGWNLVGYPSLIGYNRTDGMNNLNFGGDVNCIQWYNATSKTWHFMGESDYFRKGMGYWIHATDDMIWNVPL
jgi:hypothetical protein